MPRCNTCISFNQGSYFLAYSSAFPNRTWKNPVVAWDLLGVVATWGCFIKMRAHEMCYLTCILQFFYCPLPAPKIQNVWHFTKMFDHIIFELTLCLALYSWARLFPTHSASSTCVVHFEFYFVFEWVSSTVECSLEIIAHPNVVPNGYCCAKKIRAGAQ
jgi:hypothetical protein